MTNDPNALALAINKSISPSNHELETVEFLRFL